MSRISQMSGSQSPPLPLRSRKLKEEAVVEFSEISPSTIIVDPPESPKKSPKKKSAKKKSPKKKSQKKKSAKKSAVPTDLNKQTWNQRIMGVLEGGVPMTAKQIYEKLSTEANPPWGISSATPSRSCAGLCCVLYQNGELERRRSERKNSPYEYYLK